MDVTGQVVVVTGAASGIGKALCESFYAKGAGKIVVSDIDLEGARQVADLIGGVAIACDVGREDHLTALIEKVEASVGAIGIFCSNAGVATGFDNSFTNVAGADDAVWQRAWAINVMAHVRAARILVPRFQARRGGYFLNTISAAGLLSQIGSAPYATTKHAAVGFAEALAIAHRDDGIKVSILCPQGVDTPMLRSLPEGPQRDDGVMTPNSVAAFALQGIEKEHFLILPHARVLTYMKRKTDDYERWITGMIRLKHEIQKNGSPEHM